MICATRLPINRNASDQVAAAPMLDKSGDRAAILMNVPIAI
jgi:hypothetical protein